ncbi:hypothetical protein CY35_03G029200 [Sphagnum magellanicum]|nr:hypothetical protein CY35_03G029200 [Sphagnum magellanicum]
MPPLNLQSLLLQFWSWFCQVQNPSNNTSTGTTATTSSCFSNLHANSEKMTSSRLGFFFSWSSSVVAAAAKEFFFLKQQPSCSRQVPIAFLHTFFFIFYLSLITGQKFFHRKSQSSVVVNLLPPHRSSHCQRRSTYYNLVQFSCIYLILLNLGASLFGISDGFRLRTWSQLDLCEEVSSLVQVAAWSAIFIATECAKKDGKEYFPSLLRAWWTGTLLLSIFIFVVSVTSHAQPSTEELWVEAASLPALLFLAVVAFGGKTGFHHDAVIHDEDDIQEPLLNTTQNGAEEEEEDGITLYARAGIFSLATLSWLNPVLALGSEKILELSDLPKLRYEDRTEATYNIFNQNWEALKRKNPSQTPSISLALERQWEFGEQYLGLKIKSALTAVVYRKAIRLSSQSRRSHTSGEIINYMAVDVERVSESAWCLPYFWILPLQIFLALVILDKVVGIAWLAALVAAIFALCLNVPIEKMQESYEDKAMEAKDSRMKAMVECLRNMRVLKLQAWENQYLAKIEEIRLGEYHWLLKACVARALLSYVFWLTPTLVSLATFGMCVALGIPLTAGRILSAVATFRVLQQALNMFPDLVSYYAQTKVSLDRLWKFLQEEELPRDVVIHIPKNQSAGVAIEIEQGEFSWDPVSMELPTLTNINLKVKTGTRVAVCGTVGSGKSSLLSCILGEIPKLAGMVRLSGTTAYVAQSAWIQSGKVEDNIRFGAPMNRVWYDTVIRACALKKDLELWTFGDQTEIGERGINLSGGQKQRIQLARALYKDSDIYLLDDPFSAVDAHTGSHLFRECILEMLASKTVVYVTHQMEFLPAADLILVLDKGAIVQVGKYDELLQAGTNFSMLVDAHNKAIDSNTEVSEEALGDDGSIDQLVTEGDVLNGVANHQVGDEVDKLQKQMSFKKSRSIELHKQTSKRAKELDQDDMNRKLIKEEERERGNVSFNIYWSYATSVKKGLFIILSLLAQSTFLLLQIGSNYWMAWASPIKEGDEPKMSSTKLILVYACLSFASSLFIAMRSICVSFGGVFIAQKYFLGMIRCIFRAPMSFFDSTPAGRILNRASSDQSKLDTEVQYNLSGMMMASIQLIGVLVVMSQVSMVVLLIFLPVAAACLWMQRYYMRSAREVARLIGVEKSPILNHYGESIAGAATIRSFGLDQQFMDTNLELFDNYSRPCFTNAGMMEWLVFRMELLCSLVFSLSMVLVVLLPDGAISPSLSGLAVTYGLNLNVNRIMWNLCKLQTKIIAVERIQQYTCIPSEAPLVIEKKRPSPTWPSRGTIELENLQIRYNAHSPLVLHGITCTFYGGKKVGIVGRTGSGKSTLIQAMFRVVEPAGGRIVLDGVDITSIGLHDLRSRLSIIPQDPTLFEGTMRSNLDPHNEHSDVEVWEALDKCQLGAIMRTKDEKLDATVGENGENWSVGQRQLVCLSRALLKHTRILVLDEATASVDSVTDNVIQGTLRTEFKDCTVVTIAHRIPTVIDSDRVLVLSDGRVAEYDVPVRLLENKNSFFAKLVAEYNLRSMNHI